MTAGCDAGRRGAVLGAAALGAGALLVAAGGRAWLDTGGADARRPRGPSDGAGAAGTSVAGATPADVGEDLCLGVPPTAYDPAAGLAPDAPRPIPADARCVVCGMYPSRAPAWAAQVIFDDGDAWFLESAASLHRYLREVGRFTPGRHASRIAARWLRVGDDPGWHDPAAVTYALGGAWRGPMGPGQLRAFARPEAAAEAVAALGGQVLTVAALGAVPSRVLAPGGAHRH
jgi:nitrous oxide reductase accessory protein NosL